MELLKHTALELGAMIAKGEISSADVTDAVFAAIEAKDKDVNAYIGLSEELAMSQASALDSAADGPLKGVPIAVKDNICTKGVKTTCASKMLADFVPPFDATVVEKLKAAGMPIVGKVNMDEFAMGSTSETSYFGAVKNPHDLTRVPGGSSGGAAAAVAAGEAVCALGSDTGGSIRQPASYCGVTGFKPTYGYVSRYGLVAYASSLDQIGPIAKDVADCAAIMDVIAGHDGRDSTSLNVGHKSYLASLKGDVKGKTIGVPEECFGDGVDEDVKRAVLECAKTYESLGARLLPVKLDFMQSVIPTYYIIATAEASSNLSRYDGVKYGFRADKINSVDDLYAESRSQGFGAEVKMRILLGAFVLSSGYYDAYYKKALNVRSRIIAEFGEVFGRCDALIFPVAPSTAPKLGASLSDSMSMYLSDIFTVPVNLAGLPGLSLPCGVDRGGMPIGAQLIGARGTDAALLDLGFAYQQATNIHRALAGRA